METKESDGGNDDVDYEVFEADEVDNAATEMTLTGDYVSTLFFPRIQSDTIFDTLAQKLKLNFFFTV